VAGKRALEVRSYDHNGTIRPIIEKHGPFEYVGVNMTTSGVDVVCDAADLEDRFGAAFDVVLSSEMVEHVSSELGG